MLELLQHAVVVSLTWSRAGQRVCVIAPGSFTGDTAESAKRTLVCNSRWDNRRDKAGDILARPDRTDTLHEGLVVVCVDGTP